jgi:ribA/ribD-fused uncharacterized protein
MAMRRAELTTVENLVAWQAAGNPVDFLFFWGHTPTKDGQIGPHVFSQWWPSPFRVDGETYLTAEHFMMGEKARLFADEETRSRIMAARTPAQAKKLGREVRKFNESVWREHRLEIVTRGSVAKFSSDDSMRAYLLNTGDRVLVEASPMDRIWGIGRAATQSDVDRASTWKGLNLLGFALMAARDRLQDHA